MKVKKVTKQEPYGYTRLIEQVVNHNAEVLEDALNRISKLEKTKLSALQPVVPTQRWIPVSEELPEVMDGTMGEVSEDVLMCVIETDGEGVSVSRGCSG